MFEVMNRVPALKSKGMASAPLDADALSELQCDNWYAASTAPRLEHFAEGNLRRQGFATFYPRFRKTRRHARKVESVLAPVFPGYLFVRFDRSLDPWRSVNGTQGVLRLVGATTASPQKMPVSAMKLLFERCENGVMRSILPTLAVGQQVRLISGPLADTLASIEQFDDKGRVRVLLDILGTQASIQLDVGALAIV